MNNDQLCFTILPILTQCALDHRTISYSALGRLVGVHHRDRSLHFALGSIWQWCEDTGHPHINAIVVRKSGPRTGLPGDGYTPDGIPVSRQNWLPVRDAVFGRDWSVTFPPGTWPDGHCGIDPSQVGN